VEGERPVRVGKDATGQLVVEVSGAESFLKASGEAGLLAAYEDLGLSGGAGFHATRMPPRCPAGIKVRGFPMKIP
jgi:hypothetical protein